jgi:hypothetical protein
MLLFEHVRMRYVYDDELGHYGKTVVLMDLVQTTISGPDYCPELPEWAMGWPTGWTELKPLAMDRFHSGCSCMGNS